MSDVMTHTVPISQYGLLHKRPLHHVRSFMLAQRWQMRQQPSSSMPMRAASDDQPDLVTQWYGKIFGQKALDDRNPFGMKRLVMLSSLRIKHPSNPHLKVLH